jgi:hypothetical protein
MIRALAIAATLLLCGGAMAEEKKPRFLSVERGSSIITDSRGGQAVYTGSQKGGSLIITDPRTMKTIAVIPKEKR